MIAERDIERPLPNNLDAERALVGVGILDNKYLPDIFELSKPEDFFLEQHRIIYLASVALAADGIAVDLVTLTEYLHRMGSLNAAGGAAYIASICDQIPRVLNVKHYAQIVREKARRREVIHLCHNIQQHAFEETLTAEELAQSGVESFLSQMSRDGSASMPSTWEESTISAMNEIVDGIRNPMHTMRLNAGVAPLDKALGGLRRELVLGVGMTSHGKSLLAMQFAINGDNHGHKGLILSAEMTKESLATRELAHSSNVPLYLLRRPELIRNPDSVLSDLTDAAVKESGRKLMVVDRDITPSRVWSLCELIHKRSGLDFVIVDYDQLVIRAALGKREDEFRAQAEFMAQALAIQKRLNICFMLLCQPRKVDEDVARGRRPPRIEQIFGSSAAGNTAHVVWWIMRDFFVKGMDKQYESKATAYVLKARNDFTGAVKFGFDPDKVLFVDEALWDPEKEAQQQNETESRASRKKARREEEGEE